MNLDKVGQLIADLRREKGLTQKQLADKMGLSDKTISKWERGLGCPDVSVLSELAQIFAVPVEQILSGDLETKAQDAGNLKKMRFYVCPQCGNLLTATTTAEITCCGRRLDPLTAQKAEGSHKPTLAEIDDEYNITFEHEMNKSHYLSFVAWITDGRLYLAKLYPEQAAEVRLPRITRGQIYLYCTKHGLFAWRKP